MQLTCTREPKIVRWSLAQVTEFPVKEITSQPSELQSDTVTSQKEQICLSSTKFVDYAMTKIEAIA